jgi:hypothetical protein
MAVGTRDSVYLSGWEYNRLLQESPFTPRVSALPARFLWKGAHQLWLFRHIYVTSESLENEQSAGDALGWTTGKIFSRLAERGTVQVVNWQELDEPVKQQLKAAHTNLRQEYRSAEIRDALQAGDDTTLQDVNARLLQPLLDRFNCLASGVPNTLSHWIRPLNQRDLRESPRGRDERIGRALSTLAAPVVGGLDVCRPPGTDVPVSALQAQRKVEEAVERQMIPELLAGDGVFAGAKGYEPYHVELARYYEVYRPINDQLMSDWRKQESNLFRLRDAAEKHLWPSLHGEWIPELLADPSSAQKFSRRVQRGLQIAPIAKFLTNQPTRIIVGGLTATAAWKALDFIPGIEAGDFKDLIEVFLGAGAASELASRRVGSVRDAITLGVFYQAAGTVAAG